MSPKVENRYSSAIARLRSVCSAAIAYSSRWWASRSARLSIAFAPQSSRDALMTYESALDRCSCHCCLCHSHHHRYWPRKRSGAQSRRTSSSQSRSASHAFKDDLVHHECDVTVLVDG
jgi:hypothetical protein